MFSNQPTLSCTERRWSRPPLIGDKSICYLCPGHGESALVFSICHALIRTHWGREWSTLPDRLAIPAKWWPGQGRQKRFSSQRGNVPFVMRPSTDEAGAGRQRAGVAAVEKRRLCLGSRRGRRCFWPLLVVAPAVQSVGRCRVDC